MIAPLLLWSSLSFAQPGCNLQIQDAVTPRKFSPWHTLFVRCHPTKNLVFSNEVGADGVTKPVMINMDTGESSRFYEDRPTHQGQTARQDRVVLVNTDGLDASPSPSGNLVYVHLIKDGQPHLGVFRIGDDNKLALLTEKADATGFSFDYPSPVYRQGQEMVLHRSRNGLFLSNVNVSGNDVTVQRGRQICGNLLGNHDADQPYISGDGKFLGAVHNGRMTIMELDWSRATASGVPCRVKRRLPDGAGKISFSSDGSRVAFHADGLNNLGRGVPVTNKFNSYVMNMHTGATVPLTDIGAREHSEFPAFCGGNKVVTRVADERPTANTRFRILVAPSVAQIDAYASGRCRQSPAPGTDSGITQ